MNNYNNDTLSIIVTYNPENVSKLNTIIEIISYESDVILIDNSDDEKIILDIASTIISAKFLIQFKENKGLAFAQNIGIEKALYLNYKFVLLLDDDSIPEENFILNILSLFHEIVKESKGSVGSISARPLFVNGNKPIDLSNAKINFKNKFTRYNLMNSSGTLIPTSVLRDVGSMNEDLFIDLVDFDWCWRASFKKYAHFLCRDLSFKHSLGDNTKNIFGIKISKGSPIRNYYTYRNLFILMGKDYVPISWKISSIIKLPIKICYQILFFEDKLLRIKFIIKGLRAGYFKELGKYKP